jgi:hypothetical protein
LGEIKSSQLRKSKNNESSVNIEKLEKTEIKVSFIKTNDSNKLDESLDKNIEFEIKKKGTLGECLKKIIPFLKNYSTYINNHSCATELLRTLYKENSFLKVMNKIKKEFPNSQPLNSLLIQPIQSKNKNKILKEFQGKQIKS